MMASEAMVETFVRQKVNTVFGIVGSAFMDALDLFPEAGIRFLAGKHLIETCFSLVNVLYFFLVRSSAALLNQRQYMKGF